MSSNREGIAMFVDAVERPEVAFGLTISAAATHRLEVTSLRGREAVSRPFRFDLEVVVEDSDLSGLAGAIVGRAAVLTLRGDTSSPRTIAGIVGAAGVRAPLAHHRHGFHVRLVPRLWLLSHRTTSRVFQDMTVPAIVGAVLDGAQVSHRSALVGRHARRAYCVQRQETDLAFVTRLLAEEGIFYTFEPGERGAVIISDSAHLYPEIAGDPRLEHRPAEAGDALGLREHHVTQLTARRRLASASVLQRDHDFRRPPLELRAEQVAEDGVTEIEARSTTYEHHGEDELTDVGPGVARARLEQGRARADLVRGESACHRLVPGAQFELLGAGVDEVDGLRVVSRVEHEGAVRGSAEGLVYRNRFTSAPAKVALRPPRPRRELRQVAETAIVVGPSGQEIHTDEHGRVKVQFHWDLEGKSDERSSCWVRVAQPWAGSGFGVQFIPRVGTEVVVTFLGGDVCRPMIVGALHDGTHATPFPLPGKRTQSGIRTSSSPGGQGSNELRFDDAAGGEQVYLHAQRDLDEEIGNDHTRIVEGNEVVSIGKNLVMHIGGRQIIHVDGGGGSEEAADAPADGGDGAGGGDAVGGDAVGGRGQGGGAMGPTTPDGDATTPYPFATTPEEMDDDEGEGLLPPSEGTEAPHDAGKVDGGGGAKITDWTNKKDASKVSVLDIKGGAEIKSVDGLTITGGDGMSIQFKGNQLLLKAPTITLDATTIQLKGSSLISIVSDGETQIVGTPINLN